MCNVPAFEVTNITGPDMDVTLTNTPGAKK